MSRASRPGRRVGSLPGLWPVLVVAGLFLVVLLAVSGAYGFHPDETYYVVAGQHAALGYVDQGPVTPLLSALSVALLGVSPTAVRVLPALEMALVVVLVALMAGDLGGSRRAQCSRRSRPPSRATSPAGTSTAQASPTCSPGR